MRFSLPTVAALPTTVKASSSSVGFNASWIREHVASSLDSFESQSPQSSHFRKQPLRITRSNHQRKKVTTSNILVNKAVVPPSTKNAEDEPPLFLVDLGILGGAQPDPRRLSPLDSNNSVLRDYGNYICKSIREREEAEDRTLCKTCKVQPSKTIDSAYDVIIDCPDAVDDSTDNQVGYYYSPQYFLQELDDLCTNFGGLCSKSCTVDASKFDAKLKGCSFQDNIATVIEANNGRTLAPIPTRAPETDSPTTSPMPTVEGRVPLNKDGTIALNNDADDDGFVPSAPMGLSAEDNPIAYLASYFCNLVEDLDYGFETPFCKTCNVEFLPPANNNNKRKNKRRTALAYNIDVDCPGISTGIVVQSDDGTVDDVDLSTIVGDVLSDLEKYCRDYRLCGSCRVRGVPYDDNNNEFLSLLASMTNCSYSNIESNFNRQETTGASAAVASVLTETNNNNDNDIASMISDMYRNPSKSILCDRPDCQCEYNGKDNTSPSTVHCKVEATKAKCASGPKVCPTVAALEVCSSLQAKATVRSDGRTEIERCNELTLGDDDSQKFSYCIQSWVPNNSTVEKDDDDSRCEMSVNGRRCKSCSFVKEVSWGLQEQHPLGFGIEFSLQDRSNVLYDCSNTAIGTNGPGDLAASRIVKDTIDYFTYKAGLPCPGGCNLCGSFSSYGTSTNLDTVMTKPSSVFAVDGNTAQCFDSQLEFLRGEVSPNDCRTLQESAREACGCQSVPKSSSKTKASAISSTNLLVAGAAMAATMMLILTSAT